MRRRDALRDALRAPGADLPDGWILDASSHVLSRSDGTDAIRLEFEPDELLPAAAGGSFWDDMQSFALTWLPIIFMGLIAVAVVWMVQYMPRTKPHEIAPSSSSSVALGRRGRLRGGQGRAARGRGVHARSEALQASSARRSRKGILLHGPPGTGKTLLAKAVANESNAKFFAQSASSFVEMFAGLGAARIRRLFRQARKAAPAIVFIDELDAVGATRGNDISGEKDQTLNQLLVELDGFGGADNVVVIAASNLLEKLDPALLRPGRFDRQILVTPPDLKGRRDILEVHTARQAARRGRGHGGRGAPDERHDRRRPRQHLQRGGDLRRPRAPRRAEDHGLPGRARAGRGGHAVAARDHGSREAGGGLPRGRPRALLRAARVGGEGPPHLDHPARPALGYTLNLPEEDRYLKSKEELLDYMVVLLGGRVTEHLVFGTITTGASDDLRKVHEISRSMVTEYGMGTELMSKQMPTDDYAMSDHTRRQVDEEQQYLTDLAHRRALRMVSENRPLLDTLAHTLLENEVLEREDIERIVGDYRDGGGGRRLERPSAPRRAGGRAGQGPRRGGSSACATAPAFVD